MSQVEHEAIFIRHREGTKKCGWFLDKQVKAELRI